eukprot:230276-Rhodomonas_salina.5
MVLRILTTRYGATDLRYAATDADPTLCCYQASKISERTLTAVLPAPLSSYASISTDTAYAIHTFLRILHCWRVSGTVRSYEMHHPFTCSLVRIPSVCDRSRD